MSISITINNINDLTDTERAVLRVITGESAAFAPTVADTLKQTVREMAEQPFDNEAWLAEAAPVEPEEVYSPHTNVTTVPTPNVSDAAWLDNNLNPPADAPAPPAPASAELDSAGLPWDKRIHASTRAKVADGTWRYMRGVDKALVEQVEAELRAVQAIPVPAATHGSPELDADAAKLEQLVGVGTAGPTIAPSAPIIPLPPVPPVPAATTPMTFAQLMQHITPLLISGKLTQPKLQGVVESFGIPHLAYLGSRPDLIDVVKAKIDEVCNGAQ